MYSKFWPVLFVAFFFVFHQPSAAQSTPTWRWLQQIGGPQDDLPSGVATDASGNTIAAGNFSGTVQIDGLSLTSPVGSNRNLYVVKYDPQGTVLWARRAGDAGPGSGYSATSLSVTTDALGDVYVVGDYTGRITFGSTTLVSTGFGINAFVAKYSANGTPLWAQTVSGNQGADNYTVAVDGAGNVLVGGSYYGTISFGTLSLTSLSPMDGDVFLAKYNSQGVIQWARSIGGSSDDYVSSVCSDTQGNVYISGSFASYATFGTQSVVSNGGTDVYLAKYNAQGTLQWVNSYGGATNDFGNSTVVDSAGNVYLAGSFSGTMALTNALSLTSQGGDDGFVLACTAAGVIRWAKQVGGNGTDNFGVLAISPTNNVYAVGSFENSIVVGNQTMVSAGAADVLLARFNTTGDIIWSTRGGGTGYDAPNGLAYAGNGILAMTVRFAGSTQFGPFVASSRGAFDAVVLQIQDATPLTTRTAALPVAVAYPNPFATEFVVDLSQISTPGDITLFDSSGKQVYQEEMLLGFKTQKVTPPLGILPGVYWVQIKASGRPIQHIKLLKTM